MKVLVIGGTRFFGKRIVELLLAGGHQVSIYTRGNQSADLLQHVRHCRGDRSDRPAFENEFSHESFDAVVDNIAYAAEDVRSALRAFGGRIGHYVLTSTGSVYNDFGRLTPLAEGDADLDYRPPDYDPSNEGQAYGVGKREAERVLHREDPAFQWTVIRPPIVLGPEDPSLRLYWYIQRVADGRPVLYSLESWNAVGRHIYSADLASLYVQVVDNRVAFGKTYNAGHHEVVTPRDIFAAVAAGLNREAKVVVTPRSVIESGGLSDWYPPLGSRYVPDIFSIRRDFDFSSTGFGDWVGRTAQWFRDNHQGKDSLKYEEREREVAIAERYAADAHTEVVLS